jgi:hypothetical protein
MTGNEGTHEVGKQITLIVAIVVGLLLVGWGWNNLQFISIPGRKVPVVPQLPAIAAELKRAKSLCEGRAREAKAIGKRRLQISKKEFQRGPRLYTDTKAEFDGCIIFLCTAMERKFIENDSAEIERQLKRAGEKMTAFLDWSDKIQSHPRIGAEGSLDQVSELVVGLVKFLKDADDKIKETLRKELKDCSFRDWGDLPDR